MADMQSRRGVFWGGYAEQAGILRVSPYLWLHYKDLGMNWKELLWVLNVLSFQHTPDEPPWPAHRLLAEQMGISEKSSQRYAAGLVSKGLLVKVDRGRKKDRTLNPRGLDFQPLFDRIDQAAREDLLAGQVKRYGKESKQLRTVEEIEVRAAEELAKVGRRVANVEPPIGEPPHNTGEMSLE